MSWRRAPAFVVWCARLILGFSVAARTPLSFLAPSVLARGSHVALQMPLALVSAILSAWSSSRLRPPVRLVPPCFFGQSQALLSVSRPQCFVRTCCEPPCAVLFAMPGSHPRRPRVVALLVLVAARNTAPPVWVSAATRRGMSASIYDANRCVVLSLLLCFGAVPLVL